MTSKLNQLEFCAEASICTVEECAELTAVDVVLDIAGIPMVCNIEN
jgi:hypothetical protein